MHKNTVATSKFHTRYLKIVSCDKCQIEHILVLKRNYTCCHNRGRDRQF